MTWLNSLIHSFLTAPNKHCVFATEAKDWADVSGQQATTAPKLHFLSSSSSFRIHHHARTVVNTFFPCELLRIKWHWISSVILPFNIVNSFSSILHSVLILNPLNNFLSTANLHLTNTAVIPGWFRAHWTVQNPLIFRDYSWQLQKAFLLIFSPKRDLSSRPVRT